MVIMVTQTIIPFLHDLVRQKLVVQDRKVLMILDVRVQLLMLVIGF